MMHCQISPRCRLSYAALPLIAAASLIISAANSHACDTPVYRYAMYRWQPAPYELYYFFDGAKDETEEARAAQHDVLRELPYAKQAGNLAVIDVDVNDKQAYARLPGAIRETWAASKQQTPGYLAFSPSGGVVWSGGLELDQLKSLPNSPQRKKIAAALGAGKVGVLVMLAADESGEGEEAAAAKAANASAEAAAKEAIAKVVAGKANLYGFDENARPADAPPKDAPKLPPQPAPEVGWVRVDRNDKAESWLVRSLLAVESDLGEPQFRRQPMVFVMYGRGRALPPFVGKGVRTQNLIGDIEFITGACSCTVKDQNPGVDLLIQYDWESASKMLAAKFGSEEGNESQLGVGDLFPSLETAPTADSETGVSQAPSNDKADDAAAADPSSDGSTDDDANGTAPDRNTTTAPVTSSTSAEESTTDDPSDRSDESDGSDESADATDHSATASSEEHQVVDAGGVEVGFVSHDVGVDTNDNKGSLAPVAAVTAVIMLGLAGMTFFLLRSN